MLQNRLLCAVALTALTVSCSSAEGDGDPRSGDGGAGGNGVGATGGSGTGGSAAGGSGMGGSATGGSGGSPGGSGGSGTTAAYCDPTASWSTEWAEWETEVVAIVNQRRAEGAQCGDEQMPPVGPLVMEARLQCAARMHSMDMVERDFFDHTNPDGDGPSVRMRAAGYEGRGWGENIAGGSQTPQEVMAQWMDSPGHCTNIMAQNYNLIGVGYYPGGEWRHYWTQTFGN